MRNAPAYISDMLQPVSSFQKFNVKLICTLRQIEINSELFVPRTRFRVGERAAPRLRNALPTDIKRAATH